MADREQARLRAQVRQDYFVRIPPWDRIDGPLSLLNAVQEIDNALARGEQPQLLAVIEDYEE